MMSLDDPNGPAQRWQPLPLPSGLSLADFYAQVRRRLSLLDRIEKDIIEERSCLNMAWNRMLPFNRLPHELLVSIFALIADSLSVSGSLEFLNQRHPSVKRTKLILVCRYWRDVICASPQLWRVIHIRSPEYTERALTLSTPATIDVFFNKRLCDPKNFELLRPHTHRLRSLNFKIMGEAYGSAAIALFQGDGGTPALENLELPSHRRKARVLGNEHFVDLQLTPERFPRLRSLSVTLAVAPQNIEMYARLRKLSLHRCRCDFSFEHFLDALGASINLESLELDSILQLIHGDWAASVVSNRCSLSLCHLKSLALIAHPPIYTSRFLSHILLSPTASVQIDGDLGDVLATDVNETIPAILPSDPATVLPALRLVKEAVVYALDSEYSLSCSIEPRIDEASERPLITLRVGSRSLWEWDRFSDRAAHDLLRVFASAPLTTLDFTCDCGDVALETWTEIFNKYTLLETLRMEGDGTIETAFAGLMDATTASGSPVPCPRLRSVTVGGPFVETGIDVMLQCLRDRAGKGYRLEDVSVDLEGDQWANTLMETHYIPELESLVSNVDSSFTINESLRSLEHWDA